MKALESRTFISALVFNVIAVMVAGFIEVIPELAPHTDNIQTVLLVVANWALARFAIPGVINEVQKLRKE